MKITVEVSDSELKDVLRFTGLRKKGPALRKMVVDGLMLQRRAVLLEDFISGKKGVELAGYEESRERDRQKSEEIERALRR